MKNTIVIEAAIYATLRRHLFRNNLEQGAFLFARPMSECGELKLVVEDAYLVPARGWEVQMEVYLQMRDSERSKIMKIARDKDLATIDCHSHPHAGDDVWFSPSDVAGITEFAQYAKWKLDGKPFAAIVWGENSVDAVAWQGDFTDAERVNEIVVPGSSASSMIPKGSWFSAPRGKNRFMIYE